MMIELAPGDIFLTVNPMALGRAINAVQSFYSKDGKSTYSHAGIIINPYGATYEALWKVESKNIWKHYSGKEVLIARHRFMNPATASRGIAYIANEHNEDFYPFYRLLFHMLPPLAKISTDKVVCSELVAKFLWRVELMNWYNGCTPDDLHDMICVIGSPWEIVYHGVICNE